MRVSAAGGRRVPCPALRVASGAAAGLRERTSSKARSLDRASLFAAAGEAALLAGPGRAAAGGHVRGRRGQRLQLAARAGATEAGRAPESRAAAVAASDVQPRPQRPRRVRSGHADRRGPSAGPEARRKACLLTWQQPTTDALLAVFSGAVARLAAVLCAARGCVRGKRGKSRHGAVHTRRTRARMPARSAAGAAAAASAWHAAACALRACRCADAARPRGPAQRCAGCRLVPEVRARAARRENALRWRGRA